MERAYKSMITWHLKKTPVNGVIELGRVDPLILPDDLNYHYHETSPDVAALKSNIISFMQFMGWEATHEYSWSHIYDANSDPTSIMNYHTDGRYKKEEFIIMMVGTAGRGTRFRRRPAQDLPPYKSTPWCVYLVDMNILHAGSPGKRLLLRWYMKPFKQEHLNTMGVPRPEPSDYEHGRHLVRGEKA